MIKSCHKKFLKQDFHFKKILNIHETFIININVSHIMYIIIEKQLLTF